MIIRNFDVLHDDETLIETVPAILTGGGVVQFDPNNPPAISIIAQVPPDTPTIEFLNADTGEVLAVTEVIDGRAEITLQPRPGSLRVCVGPETISKLNEAELIGEPTAELKKPQTLEELQAAKIAELEARYEQEVAKPYRSTATGSEHLYPSDRQAREDLQLVIKRLEIAEKQAAAVGVDLSVPENLPVFDYLTMDAGPLPHTLSQLEYVLADGVDSAAPLLDYFRHLRERVKSAQTPEEVDAVRW